MITLSERISDILRRVTFSFPFLPLTYSVQQGWVSRLLAGSWWLVKKSFMIISSLLVAVVGLFTVCSIPRIVMGSNGTKTKETSASHDATPNLYVGPSGHS
jgi:hypothetical protein